MRSAIFAIITLLCGCASQPAKLTKYELGPEWKPLKEIRNRGFTSGPIGSLLGLAIASDSTVTTVMPYIYVKDVDVFLKRRLPGSAQFTALLRHEQEHAKRQEARGLYSWIWNYLYNKEFALEEEKIGWYHELIMYKNSNLPINVDGVAATLATYVNLTGRITTFEEAKAWIYSVLNGSWKPDNA